MKLPNIIIVRFDQSLLTFPLTEDGEIQFGEEFMCDTYDVSPKDLIFSAYDVMTQSSVELFRFVLSENTYDLYEQGTLPDIIKHIYDKEVKSAY